MKIDYRELLEETRKVADQAASLLRQLHALPRVVRQKGRIDLVTETDLAIEDFLRENLAPLVPGAAFLGEESTEAEKDITIPEYCWIVDPVDGTTNYAHGLPIVGIAIAFCVKGEPVVGVVEVPLMHESWYAAQGQGAFCNGKPVEVSTTKRLKKSLVATGFPYSIEDDVDDVLKRLRKALVLSRGVRRCGAAAVDLVWLAGGRFDVFYETGLKPWDMAASWCIVREAGGTVTHMDGSPFSLGRDDILACNRFLHKQAVAMVKED